MEVTTMRSMTIEGKKFDLTVREQPSQETWHWIITAPGELVLSGDAGTEIQAMRSACRAGRALARLVA
jgi:hypothetical protein